MDKKKISYLILLCLFSLSCTLQAEKYETVSPNGKQKIKLNIDKGTQSGGRKSNRQRKCKVGKEKKGESDYRRPCW